MFFLLVNPSVKLLSIDLKLPMRVFPIDYCRSWVYWENFSNVISSLATYWNFYFVGLIEHVGEGIIGDDDGDQGLAGEVGITFITKSEFKKSKYLNSYEALAFL